MANESITTDLKELYLTLSEDQRLAVLEALSVIKEHASTSD